MAKKGTITRKDIVTDDALSWGQEYARNMQIAIDKQEELKKMVFEFSKLSKQVKGAKNYKELAAADKKSIELKTKLHKLEQERVKALERAEILKKREIETQQKALALQTKTQTVQKRAIKLTSEERYELQLLNKRAKESAVISSKLSTEYEKQIVRLTKLKRSYKDVALTEGESSVKAKKLRLEIQKLDTTLKKVDAGVGEYQKNVGNYGKAMAGASRAARSMASALGLVGGVTLFVGTMRDASNIVRGFGKTMSNISGIYRTNRESLASLEDKIISVAGASVNTATEVGKLAESLATLGKSKEEIETLLEPVNNLSIGLNASADESGEFLVQMLNTFSASTDEANKYADTIATIRTSTSLDFQKIRDSFQYLAPISKALNKDIAYTGSLVGILADNGIKAERAGRLLGSSQQKLAKEGKTLNDALTELNEEKARGVSEIDLLSTASNLFGTNAAALGVVLANNTDIIDANAEAIRTNGGALDDLVNEQLKSLDAQFKMLESRWEEYILNTDKSTGASNDFRKMLKFLTDNLDKIINTTITVVKYIGLYKIVMFSVSRATKLAAAANTVYRVTMVAMNGGIRKAIIALRAMKIATAASGVGLFLVALGSAYEIYQAFADGAKDATDELKELNNEMKKFQNSQDNVSKEVNKFTEGNARVFASLEVQSKILGRVDETLKKYANNSGRYNAILVRSAKKVIKETHETEIEKIKEKIKISGTYTKRQEEYLIREIAKYQKAESLAKENEKIVDEKLKKKLEKEKEINKKLNEQRKKDSYSLKKLQLQQSIDLEKEILDNEKNSHSKRVIANKYYTDKSIELLRFEARTAIKNAKGRTDKIKEIELKFNADKNAILKNKEKTALKILGDAFKKKQAEIQKQKKAEESSINKDILIEKEFLNESLALEKSLERKEKLIKESEERIAKIKEDSARKVLENKLNLLTVELNNDKYTNEQKAQLTEMITATKLALSQLSTDGIVKNLAKQQEEERKLQEFKANQISIASDNIANALGLDSQNLNAFITDIIGGFEGFGEKAEATIGSIATMTAVVGDIMGSINQSNIEELDRQIDKNDEFFERKIEQAEGDDRLQKELRVDQEKERKQLEREKAKEQAKQAKTQKAMAIFQIGMNTAQAIMGIWAQVPKFDFGISAGLMTGIVGSLGLAQIAAVASKPIPKYAKGTSYHKGGWAEVGEERPEVIIEPNKAPYEVHQRRFLNLPEGTQVVPSLDKYQAMQNASIYASLNIDNQKIEEYQTKQNSFDNALMKELVEETKRNTSAVKNNKTNIVVQRSNDVDFEHELFRLKNTNWEA